MTSQILKKDLIPTTKYLTKVIFIRYRTIILEKIKGIEPMSPPALILFFINYHESGKAFGSLPANLL